LTSGVEPFDGDLEDYQQFLRDEARRIREETTAEQKVII
jgi:ATP-binding cassette subfamily F protein 3